jgi:hypothetical protein
MCRRTMFLLLVLIAPFLFFLSCSKPNVESSHIVHIRDTVYNIYSNPHAAVTDYSLSYNGDGNLEQVIYPGITRLGLPGPDTITFNRYPHFIVKKHANAATEDTFFTDHMGIIYKIRLGNMVGTLRYDGSQLIYDSLGGNAYRWSGGNMVSMRYNIRDSTNNTYYTDRMYAAGDYFYLQDLLMYGGSLIRNVNLLQSITYCNFQVTDDFTYSFDARSRITSCMITEPGNKYYERFDITWQ